MKKWIPIIIFAVICIGIVAFLFIKDKSETQQSKDTGETILEQVKQGLELEKLVSPPETVKEQPKYSLKRTGWIPSWDYYNGVSSILNNSSQYYSVSPVYFEITEAGEIIARRQIGNKDFPKGVKIIPTIACFDWERIGKIFGTEEKMELHKQEIIKIIDGNGYDGIDLDYESIELKNKDIFLQFIKELSEELDKKNKILSITVISQWGDNITYPSLVETRQVQDWSMIGQYADEVRIMTYDFTSPNDAEAGPIAPIIWMEEVLKYALTKIPKEKIWLGIHLYSYEWVMDQSNNKIKTNSYTYDFVSSEILTDPAITNTYDNLNAEGIAQYPCSEGYKCTLYYQEPKGVKAREDLAIKYKIAGVAYWRLGGEEKLLAGD